MEVQLLCGIIQSFQLKCGRGILCLYQILHLHTVFRLLLCIYLLGEFMASKRKLEAKLKKLRTKLKIERSDSIIKINAINYDLHFAELHLEALRVENDTLRARLSELENPSLRKTEAENELETKLLAGLNSPETELNSSDWKNIREESNKRLTGT